MPLHDIKNEIILKFREKKNTCSDLDDRFTPAIASKSLRTKESGKTPTDPHINKIAKIAKEDEDYRSMIKCINDKSPIKSIKDANIITYHYTTLMKGKSSSGMLKTYSSPRTIGRIL